jgi:hypothetical protein
MVVDLKRDGASLAVARDDLDPEQEAVPDASAVAR